MHPSLDPSPKVVSPALGLTEVIARSWLLPPLLLLPGDESRVILAIAAMMTTTTLGKRAGWQR